MNKSINFLSLGLIIALGACSVVETEKGTANLEESAFAKSVSGKGVFLSDSDSDAISDASKMKALFSEKGMSSKIFGDDSLNPTDEYTLVETISPTVAIYSFKTGKGMTYVVFKLFSYVDTNTGVKTTTVYVSDQLYSLEDAKEIATSSEKDRELNKYGSLTSPADPELVIHNPYTVMRDLIKGKNFTINGEQATVKENGDITYKGKELLLLFATADKATMALSRAFTASYYEGVGSATRFYFKIEIEDLNYTTASDYVGNITVKGVNGVLLSGVVTK